MFASTGPDEADVVGAEMCSSSTAFGGHELAGACVSLFGGLLREYLRVTLVPFWVFCCAFVSNHFQCNLPASLNCKQKQISVSLCQKELKPELLCFSCVC